MACPNLRRWRILQPELSTALLADKLSSLQAGEPEFIATANVGCLAHLDSAAGVPVVHWITLLDSADPGTG